MKVWRSKILFIPFLLAQFRNAAPLQLETVIILEFSMMGHHNVGAILIHYQLWLIVYSQSPVPVQVCPQVVYQHLVLILQGVAFLVFLHYLTGPFHDPVSDQWGHHIHYLVGVNFLQH